MSKFRLIFLQYGAKTHDISHFFAVMSKFRLIF